MADIVDRIIFDDSLAVAAVKRLAEQMVQVEDAIAGVREGSIVMGKDAGKAIIDLEGQWDSLNDQLVEYVTNADNVRTATKDIGDESEKAGKGIGGLVDGLVKVVGKRVALVGLLKVVKDVVAQTTVWRNIVTGLDAAYDTFTKRALEPSFWANLIGNIQKTVAVSLGAEEAIGKASAALGELNKKTREQIKTREDLQKVARDENQNIGKRITATKALASAEQTRLREELKLKKEIQLATQLDLTQRKGVGFNETDKLDVPDILTLNRLQAEIDGLIQQGFELTAVTELAVANFEQGSVDMIASFNDLIIETRGGTLDTLQQVAIERDAVLASLTAQRDEVFKLANLTPQQKTELDAEYKDTWNRIWEEYERRAIEAANVVQPLVVSVLSPTDFSTGLPTDATRPTPDNLDPDAFRKEQLEELTTVANGIADTSQILGSALDFMTTSTDLQIAKNAEYIDSLQLRRIALEDNLNAELELQQEGLANNVRGAEEALKAAKKQEEAALAEQARLEEKRLKQLNAQRQLEIASAAAVSIVNIIKWGTATGGPIGLAIAAAAIPAIFALISSGIAQAKNIQLFDGGMVGQPGTNWSSDRYGKGHRVLGSNLILGGDEFVVNGRTTAKHGHFLEDLNNGNYDNVNLAELARAGFQTRGVTQSELKHSRDQEMLNAAMKESMGPLLTHMKGQTQIYSYTPGDYVVEVTEGGVKKRKT